MADAPRPARRVLRILLRDAALLAALLALAELAVRTADPRYRGHRFDAEATGGHPLALNARRLRGPDVPAARAPGELRVLALGDSTTFGTGVAWDAAWPARCGEALRATALNTAVPAASVADLATAVDDSGVDLSRDAVVLAASGNMVALSWIRRGRPPAAPEYPRLGGSGRGLLGDVRRRLYDLALPSFLTLNAERAMYWIGLKDHRLDPAAPYGALLAHGWRQLDLDPAVAEEAWAAFEADLARLRDRLGAKDVPLWVTFIPARFTLSDAASDNEKAVPRARLTIDPCARTAEACRRLGLRYVDARAALRDARRAAPGRPLYRQADYTHLDEDGHRAVGEAVARAVADARRTP
jgi:lysophospholipase L1-like esterase